MSRRGLIIRLLIFGPLFAYFGFGAIQKCRLEQAAEAEAAQRAADFKAHTKTMPLGDGRTIEVIEMTPEEAAKYGYKPPEVGPAKTPEAPAKAPAATAPDATAADAKAPDAKAADATATDAKAADATATDAKAPDAKAPDAKAPDAKAPDAKAN